MNSIGYQSASRASLGDIGIGGKDLLPHYKNSLQMLDQDQKLQTTSSVDALIDQHSPERQTVFVPKKKETYVVYRHDMSVFSAQNQQLRLKQESKGAEKQSSMGEPFILQTTGQTLNHQSKDNL